MMIQRLVLGAIAPVLLFGIDGVAQSVQINGDFQRSPIPRFGHGRLVSYGVDGLTVTAYRPDGLVAFSRVLTLPDAAATRIRDVAISAEGKVAVVASAQDRSGASVSVIAWFGPGGSLDRVVVTSPYAPFKICFGADGTLWAVGRVRTADFQAAPAHDIVRRYGMEGKLLRTALSTSEFGPSGAHHPGEGALMSAAGDGIAAFLPAVGEWFEFGPAMEVKQRVRALLPEGLMVTGFGRSSDGRAVVQAMTERAGESARLILLSSAPASVQWSETEIREPFAGSLLVGGEGGGKLVFWDKRTRSLIWRAASE